MKTLARTEDKAEILRRLRTVCPDSARRFGKMSAHQMVCHLGDSFRAMMGRRPVSHESNVLGRTVVKWIALYGPFRWPTGYPTRPELDQVAGSGTAPGEFERDVANLEALVDEVTAAARRFAWEAHPVFGRMADSAWLRWAYLHMDHHLRQFGA
jgi:uncharacterized protein with PIN domain